nr:MAG TPA: hypothetical protein [Crassvirales sp.]
MKSIRFVETFVQFFYFFLKIIKSLSIITFTYKVSAWIFTSVFINYILNHFFLPVWTNRIKRMSEH